MANEAILTQQNSEGINPLLLLLLVLLFFNRRRGCGCSPFFR